MAATNVQAFPGDVTISSNLVVDTNTLFVDSVGNKVGIGTDSIGAKLSIIGASTDPGAYPTLHVGDGTADYGDYGMVNLTRHATTGGSKAHLAFIRAGLTLTAMGFYNNNTNTFGIWASFGAVTDVPSISINASKHVGIGTSAPTAGFHARTTGNSAGLGVELRSERIDNSGYYSFFKMKNIDFSATPVFHFKAYEFLETKANGFPIFLVEGSQGGNLLNIQQNGKVGIGTNDPANTTHIYKASTDQTTGLFIEKANGASGAASLFFGVTSSTETNNVGIPKAGILFQRTAGNGRGDLKFCVDYVDDTNAVGVADAKMTIKGSNGFVGIGVTAPLNALHVSSDNFATFARGTGTSGWSGIRLGIPYATNNDAYCSVIESYNNAGSNYNSILRFKTSEGNNAAATERMRIDAGGNIGIGTDSIGGRVDIRGASTDPGGFPTLHVGDATYDGGDYGMVNLTRHASTGGDKAHLAFIRNGNTVAGMGFYAGTNQFGIWTGGSSITAVPKMTFGTSGYIGNGTATPASRMHHKQPADQSYLSASLGSYQNGLILERNGNTYRWTLAVDNGNSLCFFYNTVRKGYFLAAGTDSRVNFTGQHRTFIKDVPFTRAEELEGLIVSADNNKYVKMSGGVEAGSNAITVNESLPIVSISTKVKDKKCFGVISASEDPETRTEQHGNFVSQQDKESGDTRVYINSVGEGAIWVSNIGGTLESGDYITTSNVAGYGQKQESDSLKNYTVAKITMDCDFNPVTQPIKIIKKELQDVNYWVRTTYTNVTQEQYSNLNEETRTIKLETYYTNEEGEISQKEYSNLSESNSSTYTELTKTVYKSISKEELKSEDDGYIVEVRQELVNVLDEDSHFQWEDTDQTEKAYKIRYLDASGARIDEANAVHIAAFVGCTYHCG
jgi:hypothetical protein